MPGRPEDAGRESPAARRRRRLGLVLAGGVVIAAGFAIGIVEALRWPPGSVWGVVGVAALLVLLIRAWTARR